VALMSFGVISLMDPPWLQELARPGIEAESRAYKHYGDDALVERNYARAIQAYSRSLEIKPEQVRVLLNLGIAYTLAGNTSRADQTLEKVRQMECSRFIKGVIYYNLGELRERQGRRTEAVNYYQRALVSGAEPDKAYRRLGTLYYDAQQYEQAREAFEKALASQQDLVRPYRDMLYRSLDIYEGDTVHLPIIEEQLAGEVRVEDLAPYDLEVIRQAQQTDSGIAKTHNHLCDIHARTGNVPEALAHCQASLRIWPGNPDATKMWALLQGLQAREP